MFNVTKRNGSEEPFDSVKLEYAIYKSIVDSAAPTEHSQGYNAEAISKTVAKKVKDFLSQDMISKDYNVITTDLVMNLVGQQLMLMKYLDAAQAYIIYREHNKPDIFRKRTNFKPFEYPELYSYVEAIRHSYWIHTEFDYSSDIQDIRVNMSEAESTAALRAMLAISQIEVGVKTFWAKIGDVLGKPEIQAVGVTFAESEVRHADAYANLLEIMGLNQEFTNLKKVPAIQKRIDYLERALVAPTSQKDYFYNVVLFSMLIENVSLFSQFYILMSFNKHRSYLTGTSNAISATSKEETIHANFGMDIVNNIKKEHPEWWTVDVVERIQELVQDAIKAELSILDWIFEKGEFEYLTKADCKAFLEIRVYNSLKSVGIDIEVSAETLLTANIAKFEWFEVAMTSTGLNDAFNKRFTNYVKREVSISKGDLF